MFKQNVIQQRFNLILSDIQGGGLRGILHAPVYHLKSTVSQQS